MDNGAATQFGIVGAVLAPVLGLLAWAFRAGVTHFLRQQEKLQAHLDESTKVLTAIRESLVQTRMENEVGRGGAVAAVVHDVCTHMTRQADRIISETKGRHQ
jgi:hypothetical protein